MQTATDAALGGAASPSQPGLAHRATAPPPAAPTAWALDAAPTAAGAPLPPFWRAAFARLGRWCALGSELRQASPERVRCAAADAERAGDRGRAVSLAVDATGGGAARPAAAARAPELHPTSAPAPAPASRLASAASRPSSAGSSAGEATPLARGGAAGDSDFGAMRFAGGTPLGARGARGVRGALRAAAAKAAALGRRHRARA
jgi:hypothetical protein